MDSKHQHAMHKVSSLAELNLFLLDEKPVVVDYTAAWCGPCQKIHPVLEKLAQKYAKVASFVEVDIDQVPELSTQARIKSIPTIRVLSGRNEVFRSKGTNLQSLKDWLESLV